MRWDHPKGTMNEKHSSLMDSLRTFPAAAWILFAGSFLNKFGTFVLPFLAIYMTGLGYTTTQAGLAIGAYGVGTLIASLLGGWLADRFGRRRTIVLSMFSGAASMLWLSQATSLAGITCLAGLVGLTGELYRPASSALLTDLVPSAHRVTAFAAYRMAINAGFAFGPATAGLLAEQSFTWLFVGDAFTSVLFGTVALLALPGGRPQTEEANGLLQNWRILRQDARLRRVLLASLLIGLVFVQVFSTMSLEITQSGFTAATYGAVISLNGALVVLFELPIASISRRFPALAVMALGYVLIGLGFASNALDRTIPLLVLTTVVFTLGEMIAMPVSTAYVANLAPADQRGMYLGLYGLVWSIAFVAGPSIGMSLFSVHPTALWIGCGVFGVLAALLILGGARAPQQVACLNTVPSEST